MNKRINRQTLRNMTSHLYTGLAVFFTLMAISFSCTKGPSSVTISPDEIEITEGDSYELSVSVSPEDAKYEDIIWTSSDPEVASVNNSGIVQGLAAGVATITATSGNVSGSCKVTVKNFTSLYSGTIDGHNYVDLGLSVKWATCNLGAQEPWDIGEYYAWGDVKPYTQWTYANYSNNFTYAPCSPDYVLDAKFDAITTYWGKSWRMPTLEEIQELLSINNCDWIWIENIKGTDISGYQVKSKKNGNSIFLPAGKYIPWENYMTPTKVTGNYWSSTTDPSVFKSPWNHSPRTIRFQNGYHDWAQNACYDGLTIRGVVGPPNSYLPDEDEYKTIDTAETERQGFTVSGRVGDYTYVNLGLPSKTLWATYNVGASLPHEYGEYYAWGESSPKALYDEETYKYFIGYSDSGSYHYAQYSKYIWNSAHGKPDYIMVLEPEDDAASVNWGPQWQTPSKEQFEELAYYCKWYRKDITIDGKIICGYVGESMINGYKIYIPLADRKYKEVPMSYLQAWYWSRNLSGDTNKDGTDYRAWYMTLDHNNIMTILDTSRYQGLTIRAVVTH